MPRRKSVDLEPEERDRSEPVGEFLESLEDFVKRLAGAFSKEMKVD